MPISSTADDRLWTIEDLSAYLGIPVATLYRGVVIAAGRLPIESADICDTYPQKSLPG